MLIVLSIFRSVMLVIGVVLLGLTGVQLFLMTMIVEHRMLSSLLAGLLLLSGLSLTSYALASTPRARRKSLTASAITLTGLATFGMQAIQW